MKTKAKTITLYLASWQKRMMKDYMPRSAFKKTPLEKITKVIIKPGRIKCPASYKIVIDWRRTGEWVMYLTDEQINIVHENFGLRTPISSINVSPETIQSGDIAFQ